MKRTNFCIKLKSSPNLKPSFTPAYWETHLVVDLVEIADDIDDKEEIESWKKGENDVISPDTIIYKRFGKHKKAI